MGKDTIFMERVILTPIMNVFILRKIVGTTKIIVPVEMEVTVSANCLYGDIWFFSNSQSELRNENTIIKTKDYI